MPQIDPDHDYTPRETAPILHKTETTLAADRANGKGPKYRKAGRVILYPGSELLKYLEDCLVTPTPASERRRQSALAAEAKQASAA